MQSGVCFGAGALWQGGACCCTSVSELSDLCRVGGVGWGWGRGWRLHNCVMSGPEREPSGLCHGCWGTPPFTQSHSFSLSLPGTLPPPLVPPPSVSGYFRPCHVALPQLCMCQFSTFSHSLQVPAPPVVAFMAPYLFYYNSNCHYYFSCPPSPSD